MHTACMHAYIFEFSEDNFTHTCYVSQDDILQHHLVIRQNTRVGTKITVIFEEKLVGKNLHRYLRFTNHHLPIVSERVKTRKYVQYLEITNKTY